jgi:hypothetical protein
MPFSGRHRYASEHEKEQCHGDLPPRRAHLVQQPDIEFRTVYDSPTIAFALLDLTCQCHPPPVSVVRTRLLAH